MHYILLILIGLSCNSFASDNNADATLTELNGKQISFHSLQGKWVMINYWASWCQPCLAEIGELNTFYYRNHDKVQLFAVNYDGLSIKQQKQLIHDYKITYPSLREDPADSLALGDLVGVPATFVFNPQGKWVTTLYGAQTLTTLDKAIGLQH